MTEIGEVLVTADLHFSPSDFMWSRDGKNLIALGTASCVALNAASGERRWDASWSDKGAVALTPDATTIAFAGGGREPIEEYEPPLDCSELPLGMRGPCEKHNRDNAGWHVVGYKTLPNTLGALSGETGSTLWKRSDLTEQVGSLRYSPDGTLLLGTSQEHTLLFDAATGNQRSELPPASVSLTAFSGDSQRLVTADSTSLTLIDTSSGTTRWVTSLSGTRRLTFTDNDSALLVATERQALVLRPDDGSVVASAELQNPLPNDDPLMFSPDGKHLVGVGPSSVALWDVADGSRRFETPAEGSVHIRFNPVLPEIAITSGTGVKTVNARRGTTVWEQATGPVSGLAFSPDGMRLALCETTGIVHVHSMNPTSVSHRVCDGPVAKVALTSGPDPLAVAVSHVPGAETSVFHADTGDLVLTKPQPGVIAALALSRDGRHFATGGSDGEARLFTTLTGDKVWQVAHQGPLNALAFLASGDGDVITAAGDKTTRRLDRGTGDERWRLVHPNAVTLLATSPDGRFVATACTDLSTRIVDAGTGEKAFSIAHDGKIRVIAFSPTSSMLAAGGEDGEVLIIDAPSGTVVGKSVHTRGVTAAAFSHDGKLLATAAKDHAVNLLDVSTDPPHLTSTRTVTRTITRLAFHPAEPQLALVCDEPGPMAMITDAAEGTELSELAHPDVVNDLAYSPDGDLLATACEDTLVRVYRGRRGT
ncbi:WD40 repeat domain-containing protein [Streptomyces sp. NPDC017958]|uniref:WD40 repeat domain-containing protein n=1 Tax=Streptomyces sp. NPDC017958 TaxID=3365021 RepID=UPI0037BC462E